MKRPSEIGFSTIEVIAAVAMIAVALIPIATLQTQIARGQARLEDARESTSAVQNAIAIVRTINPMQTPNGRRALSGGATLTWVSTPASPVRPSVNPPGFEVQLYRIRSDVQIQPGTSNTFEMDILGWRPVSQPTQ